MKLFFGENELDIAHILHGFVSVWRFHLFVDVKADHYFPGEEGSLDSIGIDSLICRKVNMINLSLIGLDKLVNGFIYGYVMMIFGYDFAFEQVNCCGTSRNENVQSFCITNFLFGQEKSF